MHKPHEGTPPRIPGYDDGFPNTNGAAETPSDSLHLDKVVYPHRPEEVEVPFDFNETYEQFEERYLAAQEGKERQDYWDSRNFQLSQEGACGAPLTPSRKR